MSVSSLKIKRDPRVKDKFATYPSEACAKLYVLRDLILQTAEGLDAVTAIEETLKWGEPSYLAKKGSTIRIDWKAKSPQQYAMYFQCTSKLVPSFKAVFGDLFKYEKNRAILFDLDEELPEKELKACIAAALQYHRVKDLPLLGL